MTSKPRRLRPLVLALGLSLLVGSASLIFNSKTDVSSVSSVTGHGEVGIEVGAVPDGSVPPSSAGPPAKQNLVQGEIWIRGIVFTAYGTPMGQGAARLFAVTVPEKLESISETPIQLGTFQFRVAAGQEYEIAIHSEDWGDLSSRVSVGSSDVPLRYSYECLSSVSGVIVGSEASIETFQEGPWPFFIESVVVGGPPILSRPELDRAELRFEHSGLGPGQHRVVGSVRGKWIVHPFIIPKNGDDVEVAIDLEELAPSQVFLGRAVLGDSGEPLRNVHLRGLISFHGMRKSIPSVSTDEDGRFFFEMQELLAGVRLELSRGHEYPRIDVEYQGAEHEHVVRFPNPPERRAIVVDCEGIPVPAVVAYLRSQGRTGTYQKRTDPDGAFTIMEMVPGDYDVQVLFGNGSRFESRQGLHVGEGRGDAMILMETVSGVVTLSAKTRDGEPAISFFAWAFVRHGNREEFVGMNWPPGTRVPLVSEPLQTRSAIGLKDADSVDFLLISTTYGFRKVSVDRVWLSRNRHLDVTFELPPIETVVKLTTASGLPVTDPVFWLPGIPESELDEKEHVFGSVPEGSMFVSGAASEVPGEFHILVYKGQGLEIDIRSATSGAVRVLADAVLDDPVVVFPDQVGRE